MDPESATEVRKAKTYRALFDCFLFVPMAVETLKVIGPASSEFLEKVGRRIT